MKNGLNSSIDFSRERLGSLARFSLRLSFALIVLPSLLSCSSSGKRDGNSLSNSASDSTAGSGSGYQLPPYQEKTLANGLRVLFVPDDKLPYINYSLMIRSGSTQDPAEQAGLASFVAELLDKGTVKRGAPQIAHELGVMGAEFDASAAYDYSLMGASALSTQAEKLLKDFLEIVTQPAFSDSEIERMRKQMIAGIERRVDNPDAFTDLAFSEMLYGSHPYGRASSGTVQTVGSIKKKHIIQHYLRHYRPNNAILAVVGKYTPALAGQIEQSFGAWQMREVPAAAFPQVKQPEGVKIRLMDKPGLVQAQIRFGHLGIKRQNEDFLALRVANTILGGAFASRLNDRIRKDLGLTYTISSVFDARQDTGPFEISTFTKNGSVGQTISETLKLLGEFREKGVNSEEVTRVKGYLKGVFPTAIETQEKLAFNLLVLRLYGIPDSYLTNYLRDIERLSSSDINRVIKKYIDEKNIAIVVYSSAPEVIPQLQPLTVPPNSVEVRKARLGD